MPYFGTLPLHSRIFVHILHALRDLIPSVQFKKREKHRWKSIIFRKVLSRNLQLY